MCSKKFRKIHRKTTVPGCFFLTLCRMGFFGALHGWGEAKKSPLPKICHTHPAMIKLCLVIPYPRKTQTIYESRDIPLSSADISIFSS